MGVWPPAMLGKYHGTEKWRLGQKNTPLTQRLAGLSQRLAVRRAFGGQKSEKRLKISRHSSRQGYASDFRLRQSFLTMSAWPAATYDVLTKHCDAAKPLSYWELL
jgi:hypothetical protein